MVMRRLIIKRDYKLRSDDEDGGERERGIDFLTTWFRYDDDGYNDGYARRLSYDFRDS